MKNMSSKLITGSLLGAALGMYAISQMKPRERKRMMKRGRKILSTATRAIDGLDLI